MQILIDLVKLGAIGASLAFLLLSFWLLYSEMARKDKQGNPFPPRPEILRDIRRFRHSALVFLIVGVVSEFFLTHGVEVVAAASQIVFKDQLVRVRFNEWEFAPEKHLISFGFEENRVDTRNYVLPTLSDQYDVYVGVRQKTTTAYDRGPYPLMFGPYHISTQPTLNQTLNGDEMALLGEGCIEFTAFGTPKVDGKPAGIDRPFDPSKSGLRVNAFNNASVCADAK